MSIVGDSDSADIALAIEGNPFVLGGEAGGWERTNVEASQSS